MEIPSFSFYSVNNELESFQLLFRAFPPSKPYTFNLFSNLYCLRLSSKIKQKFDTTRFPNFFLSSHQHQLKILSISSTLSITRSISRTNRETCGTNDFTLSTITGTRRRFNGVPRSYRSEHTIE